MDADKLDEGDFVGYLLDSLEEAREQGVFDDVHPADVRIETFEERGIRGDGLEVRIGDAVFQVSVLRTR